MSYDILKASASLGSVEFTATNNTSTDMVVVPESAAPIDWVKIASEQPTKEYNVETPWDSIGDGNNNTKSSLLEKIKTAASSTPAKVAMGLTALAIIGFTAKKMMSKKTTKKGSDLKGFTMK
jgi:hypothetical protein|tara:strand:+ start:128 stop:493 length:366 start_codon:yes stop_codon:yes gene_type:complete